MICAVVNTMDGVGKTTTTAVHLATMLARTERTLVIDGDPHASAASWAAWRREAHRDTSTCFSGKAILSQGKTRSEGFSHTVVDAGAAIPRDCAAPCSWRTRPLCWWAPQS